MKALLLSAGYGTRLRPLTYSVPKCLVPIHGKPLLAYWLDLLMTHHVEEILINTHYLPSMVEQFITDYARSHNIKLIHEEELLGTAGTVLANRDFLHEGPFLLAHVDNLTRFDVTSFCDAHVKRHDGVEITMMTFATDSPQSCGIVEVDNENRVTAFHEKIDQPPSNHANAAVYIVEPSVIDFMVTLNKRVIDFSTEVLPHYLCRMQTYHNSDYHRDIGTLDSLRLAELEYE